MLYYIMQYITKTRILHHEEIQLYISNCVFRD
jgi:hypothetical protein